MNNIGPLPISLSRNQLHKNLHSNCLFRKTYGVMRGWGLGCSTNCQCVRMKLTVEKVCSRIKKWTVNACHKKQLKEHACVSRLEQRNVEIETSENIVSWWKSSLILSRNDQKYIQRYYFASFSIFSPVNDFIYTYALSNINSKYVR